MWSGDSSRDAYRAPPAGRVSGMFNMVELLQKKTKKLWYFGGDAEMTERDKSFRVWDDSLFKAEM